MRLNAAVAGSIILSTGAEAKVVPYSSHMDREQDIPFVYENGVLRPEGPVDFPEGTRGIAHIRETHVQPNANAKARAQAIKNLHRISESEVFNSGGHKLTRDQMHERH